MRKFIPVIFIFILVLANCSFVTPAPDFEITSFDPIAFFISAPGTASFSSIEIKNTSSVDCRITRMRFEYLHSTTSLATYPETPYTYDVFIAGSNLEDMEEPLYNYGYLEGITLEVPQDVYDDMVSNEWDSVTLRTYITVEDNYGYGKTTEKYFDIPVKMF